MGISQVSIETACNQQTQSIGDRLSDPNLRFSIRSRCIWRNLISIVAVHLKKTMIAYLTIVWEEPIEGSRGRVDLEEGLTDGRWKIWGINLKKKKKLGPIFRRAWSCNGSWSTRKYSFIVTPYFLKHQRHPSFWGFCRVSKFGALVGNMDCFIHYGLRFFCSRCNNREKKKRVCLRAFWYLASR